ncbi:hypothetical protein HMPREF9440_00912 [Sutterella parvirubra YIT 11816]|uniref:Uncharacterized protein n=1 Tax=Sutterella parvirubra YIT 11816 TaxID=762967 RepID=H3KDV1_9BURK|nr:hypothetical protein HMPREF9440_00912 [Sutterella parvirubra YIT 11816]
MKHRRKAPSTGRVDETFRFLFSPANGGFTALSQWHVSGFSAECRRLAGGV